MSTLVWFDGREIDLARLPDSDLREIKALHGWQCRVCTYP